VSNGAPGRRRMATGSAIRSAAGGPGRARLRTSRVRRCGTMMRTGKPSSFRTRRNWADARQRARRRSRHVCFAGMDSVVVRGCIRRPV